MRSKNKLVYEGAEYSGVACSYNLVLVLASYVKQTKSCIPYYRGDVHMFSVVHRQHFSLYCRVFLETLACHPSCSSPEGYCWEIKQQQKRILVWIFSSCIRVNKIGRRIPTSTLWAPPGIWSYHVRGFPQSTTAFRANVPLAVPKVRKRSPKRFSAKNTWRSNCFVIHAAAPGAPLPQHRCYHEAISQDEGICPQLLVSLTVQRE